MIGEYIYKNKQDTVRIKIFARQNQFNEWDADIWERNENGNHSVITYSSEVGDLFDRRKDAKQEMIEIYGELKSINPDEAVTNGWESRSSHK